MAVKYPRMIGLSSSAVLLAFFLCSCVTSRNPLGDKASAVHDKTLTGVWYFEDKGTPGREEYLAASFGDAAEVTLITFDNEGSPPEYYFGHITEIDGDRFLNLRPARVGRDIDDNFIFMRYYVSTRGELVLAPFNTDFFREAVEMNEIRGRIKGQGVNNVLLTDTTANIAEFLRKSDKERYLDDPLTMRRAR